MSTVKYVDVAGAETEVEAEAGESVMTLGVNNLVDGMVGECGGAMACATCHCYVDEATNALFAPISEMEEAMLEMVPDRKPNSRLGCQLELADDTPDIVVNLPEQQY